MTKSNVSRAAGILMLLCVPAMAAIPPADPTIKILLKGAGQVDAFHYKVAAGRPVTLELETTPGDTILVMAAPMKAGEYDASQGFQLLLERNVPTGTESLTLLATKDLVGMSFALGAINRSPKGEWGSPMIIQVDVVDPPQAPGTGPGDPALPPQAPDAGLEEDPGVIE
jgi:hypothetical protein